MKHEHLNPDPALTPQEASEYLNVNEKTLANRRCRGEDPRFFKIGGSVRYRRSHLDTFLDECEAR